MIIRKIINRFFLAVVLNLAFLSSVLPHAGEDHGPKVGDAGATTGPITLAPESIQNLGIQTVEAKIEPIQRTLRMVAVIEPLPEKHAKISARFEGRVLEIVAGIGQKVKKGDLLLKLDPTMIGNPPVLLKASIDGYVTSQNLTVGQAFTSETVLMEIADYQKILAKGTTFENPDIGKIKVGAQARIIVDIFPGETFEGTVQRIDAGFEPETHAFEVFVLLQNPDLRIKPNMQASLYVGLGDSQEVLVVPRRAILGGVGNFFVFVRDKDTFEKRSIAMGITAGDRVEILEGVFPGEQVVVQGNYQLQFATGKPKPPGGQQTTVSVGRTNRIKLVLAFFVLVALGIIVHQIRRARVRNAKY